MKRSWFKGSGWVWVYGTFRMYVVGEYARSPPTLVVRRKESLKATWYNFIFLLTSPRSLSSVNNSLELIDLINYVILYELCVWRLALKGVCVCVSVFFLCLL